MSFSGAVEWWEEWQLRILVLASLFIQFFLYFSLWVRKSPGMRRLRVLVWIAYIGGDAVAIYALATLFNRHKQISDGERSPLEVLWAPLLLIHLGGQPWITAYSLEDNELWKRHTITMVSQVTVALYVCCKWRSGEKTLLAAMVLLFIIGILKFSRKPWALKTASFNNLQATFNLLLSSLQREEPLRESMYSLERYVQEAKKCVLDTNEDSQYQSIPLSLYMFVDQSAPHSFRIEELSSFLRTEYKDAYNRLQECLGQTFSMLYTRMRSFTTPLNTGLMFLLPFLALASVALFATSHKGGHKEDITVTYILFCCTTMLEFLLPCMAICSSIPCCNSFIIEVFGGWHDIVSQYNMVSFCVRKKKPTFLMKIVAFNFLRKFVNQHWYIQQVPIAYQITRTVFQHVEDGWNNYIHDATSYRRFSELRDQWTLRRNHQLGWSLKMPFDESVLIWHIATDLCYYHPNTSPQCRQRESTQRGREISNYMIYLLLLCPEMLMPGTRSHLFTLASDQIVKNSKGPLDMTEDTLAREILNMSMVPTADDMISNARKLAEALMELRDEEERWTVIQGVWVEMLCYSASRCRGYLHAKSLGEGGEYLSYIWLLWASMGMETLADRHQSSDPPQEEEEAALTSRSQGRVDRSQDNLSPV